MELFRKTRCNNISAIALNQRETFDFLYMIYILRKSSDMDIQSLADRQLLCYEYTKHIYNTGLTKFNSPKIDDLLPQYKDKFQSRLDAMGINEYNMYNLLHIYSKNCLQPNISRSTHCYYCEIHDTGTLLYFDCKYCLRIYTEFLKLGKMIFWSTEYPEHICNRADFNKFMTKSVNMSKNMSRDEIDIDDIIAKMSHLFGNNTKSAANI